MHRLRADPLNAEREIEFYFFDKIQNACEPRNPRADPALCAAANTSSGCSAHPFKCVWRKPTASGGTCGVKGCCSALTSGPTCHFDCAACRTGAAGTGIDKQNFDKCCNSCEYCAATGTGVIATEKTCGCNGKGCNGTFDPRPELGPGNRGNPGNDPAQCAWN